MENYIHQSQLDDLVSSIIGELFVKKSNNLVAFVINYLHRYHYDKVHDIIKEIKLPDKSYRLVDLLTYMYYCIYMQYTVCSVVLCITVFCGISFSLMLLLLLLFSAYPLTLVASI